jgi:hypothetical protein
MPPPAPARVRSPRAILGGLKVHLKRVTTELTNLLGHRWLYKQVLGMVERNQALRRPSSFYSWMRSQYSTYMAIGVRRLVDHDKRTLSLRRLLEKIKANHQVFDPDRHANMYRRTALGADTGRREFAGYARTDGRTLDRQKLRSDLSLIKRTAERIKRYVDKHVAHTDRIQLRRLPTFAMLDVTLDTLKDVTERYRILITGHGGDLTPSYIDAWEGIFEVAWAPRPEP